MIISNRKFWDLSEEINTENINNLKFILSYVINKNKSSEIELPDKLDKKKKNLIIFDDVINDVIKIYFTKADTNIF